MTVKSSGELGGWGRRSEEKMFQMLVLVGTEAGLGEESRNVAREYGIVT